MNRIILKMVFSMKLCYFLYLFLQEIHETRIDNENNSKHQQVSQMRLTAHANQKMAGLVNPHKNVPVRTTLFSRTNKNMT